MDGISAIGVARKERPDLVILDLGLPGGDGFVVLERTRSLPDLVAIQ
jgi:DNA-binding response OmpR family regulator